MNTPITIEDFNRMVKQETLHPLVTIVKPSPSSSMTDVGTHAEEDWEKYSCDFYALIYKPSQSSLRLYRPGDEVSITCSLDEGVLFHPDLLCGSHLERDISKYPVRCRCKALTKFECHTIACCLADIDSELHHSIDRFTSMIIVSHIALLLDYCVRFCDAKK